MSHLNTFKQFSRRSLGGLEYVVLIMIAIFTLIAIGQEILLVIENRTVRLADLLLLFIYLEVLAMVATYWDSGRLPVRMPIYIAIVAIARHMILDMKNMDHWTIISLAVSALILSATVLIIRYGHLRMPYPQGVEND